MEGWEGLRARMLKRVPVGVLLAPFEFGTAVTWLAYGIRLMVDNFTPGHDLLRATLPLSGTEFTLWSILLPTSAAMMIIGLISTVVWPVSGLYIERTGLIGMAVTIATLMYALVTTAHLSLISLTAINTGTTILVVILRFVVIGQTLDTLRKRLDSSRETH